MANIPKLSYRPYHYIIEKAEPWTTKEINSFTNQEREFIRDIQISKTDEKGKYLTKKQGINYYMDYLDKSKKARKKLRKEIIDHIHSIYPKHKKTGIRFKPKSHLLPNKNNIFIKEDFSPEYKTFEDWYSYSDVDTSSNYFKRISKAHNKNPDKTLKQLRSDKR